MENIELKHLSYSKLSKFDRNGPEGLISSSKGSRSMSIGSIVDNILTTDKDINDEFHIYVHDKPTSSLLILFNNIKEDKSACINTGGKLKIVASKINKIAKSLKLWSNIKSDVLFEQKWNNHKFTSYLYEYLLNKDKIEISSSDYELAKQLVTSLSNNSTTKDYFIPKMGEDIIFQLELNFEFDKYNYKSFIDGVRINHYAKEIIPYDLKTGEERMQKFSKSWNQYRYDLQYSIYVTGLRLWVNENYPDYNLLPMEYIYISKKQPNLPIIIQIDEQWIDAGMNGYTTSSGYRVKGFLELSELVKWHFDNQVFDRSKSVAENGFMSLGFYGEVDYE